jgi:hypothetical protein
MADPAAAPECVEPSGMGGPVATRPAALLRKGDVVRTPDGTPAEITREPLTMHSGWSLFDQFEVLVLVGLRPLLQDAKPENVRWRPDQPIDLLR